MFLAGQKHQAQHGRADRSDCHPGIVGGFIPTRWDPAGNRWMGAENRGFEPVFRRRMAALGIPMWAHCVRRGEAEQERLKREGFSQAGFGASAHNWGCAVDFVHGTKAWDLTPIEWELVGHIGHETARTLGLKVVWGGDDTEWDPGDTFRWDPAHWELKNWREVRACIRVTGPTMSVHEALFQMAL